MSKFLLLSFPICEISTRYYPAAYIAGIVAKTNWEIKYIDLSGMFFNVCAAANIVIPKWDSPNQLEIFTQGKEIFQEILNDIYKSKIKEWNPELIGFSLMNSNRHFAIFSLREFEKLGNTIPVIFGGPDCFPSEYHLNYIAERCPPNIMLQGEAEIALPKFLNEYQVTKSIQTKIAGFIYKDNKGEIIDTGLPELSYLKGTSIIADYSIFDYVGLPLEADGSITTFSSKGCINKCAFCSETRNYRPYRRREAKEVISEVEKNLKILPASVKGKEYVLFRDAIFNASTPYLTEICELILANDFTFTWGCLGAFKNPMTTDLLGIMHRSGCRDIFFGFESASQRVIDLMGKNFNITMAQQIIENCLAQGIRVNLPIINGFPGEFTRDFLTNLTFILRYRDREYLAFSYSNSCQVRKGTPLYDYPQDFLIADLHDSEYSLQDNLNTRQTRLLRQCLAEALMRKSDISSLQLQHIDFNDVAVAAELARIIFFTCVFLHIEEKSKFFLESFRDSIASPSPNIETNIETAHLHHAIPSTDLYHWFVADKNSLTTKQKILLFLEEIIQSLETAVLAPPTIDFRCFRNSLYDIDIQRKHSILPPLGFQLHSVRVSQYDGGNHIIFAGSLDETKSGSRVSWLEANCGDYCFDLHWGTNSYFPVHRDCQYRLRRLNFWGKLPKKMLHEHDLFITVIYHDHRRETFAWSMDMILARPKLCKKNTLGDLFYFWRR